jgi:[ribosomal protein S18]-alanine N-acetyltransferase
LPRQLESSFYSKMLELIPNDRLDLATLGALLSDREDVFLVWPEARFPFDGEQWREKLTSHASNRSYFVSYAREIIGHGALLQTHEPHVLALSYLFIRADPRGKGFGGELMALLEHEASRVSGISGLMLRVRTYNPRAKHLYEASGFVATEQDGSLIIMRKTLPPRRC